MKHLNIFLSAALIFFTCSTLNAQSIEKEIEKIANDAQGRVGAGLMLAETGEASWLNAEGNFPMQSVYKLPIAMAALSKVDKGFFGLDSMILVKKSDFISKKQYSPIRDKNPKGNFHMKVLDLIRYAVSESDGTASDVLMRLCGGPGEIMKYLAGLGIKDIYVKNTEKQMGLDYSVQYKNTSTPREAVRLLYLIYKGGLFKKETEKLLSDDMTNLLTSSRRIKGLLPKDTKVAHKTGTSGTEKGIAAATNDIGIVTLPDGRHLLVAVFVSDSKAPEAVREGVIARIAKTGWDKYVK
ncbi:MAG: class A beta-lactamase [Bacteroidota bacterium]|jgi:beta-lactamase class A|nr:class A beta-lactamase [Ignavibacteria bacterium]MCU7499749.1 class A beta-lactamase [Ignavibacteria bacterium]MCU7511503.1 class A beta-lactamase [Ignavibacteria bacterium]MCU7519500.1 class A beta-lactamase [Ignavibacteria bacterium]